MKKSKYYSLKNILSKNCTYSLIIGERSNGKTYACLKYGIEQYVRTGAQLAVVRRWQDDFKSKRGASMFDALIANGEIDLLTNHQWTDVYYYGSRWFFCRYDENKKRIVSDDPFAFAFAISSMEHDKSTSYPRVKTVVFDEFITRSYYLPDEFILFMNVLSTIVRQRSDVKILMCGNTVSKTCPYFVEMGLTHIKKQQPGTIDVYTYGDSSLTVAVELCAGNVAGKDSNRFFAFDNPRLSMITGNGSIWEMAIYPHCPCKYTPADIQFIYFVEFDGDLLQCEIVLKDDLFFTFVHRKTTPIKDQARDIIFSPDVDARPNHFRRITKPTNDLTNRIADFYRRDKVFYADNEVGEIMRNYLQWSSKTQ